MASAITKWQLRRIGARLRSRRAELEQIGEQLVALDDAPAAEALERHRTHVLAEVRRLEVRQDELLDRI